MLNLCLIMLDQCLTYAFNMLKDAYKMLERYMCVCVYSSTIIDPTYYFY